MAIERTVSQPRPRYVAAITSKETAVEAAVGGDTVELKVPGARAILRVPIEDWAGFVSLVDSIAHALVEKATYEGATVALPWEQDVPAPSVPDPSEEAVAVVLGLPGGPDDALSAPPHGAVSA